MKTKQLELFNYPKCHICGGYLMPKDSRGVVLDGFVDKDNGLFCHTSKTCRRKHYIIKMDGSDKTTFSEFPVVV